MSRCERCDRPDCPSRDKYCVGCPFHPVDWRARYFALRDAVREAQAAFAVAACTCWSCWNGDLCRVARKNGERREAARAAVDRILDGAA